MKRIATAWLAALGFLLLVATLPTYAQPAGRDYVTIDPPLNSDSPGKIEVIEFFSFACPHCNDLQPLLNTWETKLPRDVVFKRVPVVFNPFYQLMAKLYYALEITGDLARLDPARDTLANVDAFGRPVASARCRNSMSSGARLARAAAQAASTRGRSSGWISPPGLAMPASTSAVEPSDQKPTAPMPAMQ